MQRKMYDISGMMHGMQNFHSKDRRSDNQIGSKTIVTSSIIDHRHLATYISSPAPASPVIHPAKTIATTAQHHRLSAQPIEVGGENIPKMHRGKINNRPVDSRWTIKINNLSVKPTGHRQQPCRSCSFVCQEDVPPGAPISPTRPCPVQR